MYVRRCNRSTTSVFLMMARCFQLANHDGASCCIQEYLAVARKLPDSYTKIHRTPTPEQGKIKLDYPARVTALALSTQTCPLKSQRSRHRRRATRRIRFINEPAIGIKTQINPDLRVVDVRSQRHKQHTFLRKICRKKAL